MVFSGVNHSSPSFLKQKKNAFTLKHEKYGKIDDIKII